MPKLTPEQLEYYRQYRVDQKESINATHKAWRMRNTEKIREKNKAYRLAHKKSTEDDNN